MGHVETSFCSRRDLRANGDKTSPAQQIVQIKRNAGHDLNDDGVLENYNFLPKRPNPEGCWNVMLAGQPSWGLASPSSAPVAHTRFCFNNGGWQRVRGMSSCFQLHTDRSAKGSGTYYTLHAVQGAQQTIQKERRNVARRTSKLNLLPG